MLAGRTMLVVDDEADVREVLSRRAGEHGARVVTRGLGRGGACAASRRDRPDVVRERHRHARRWTATRSRSGCALRGDAGGRAGDRAHRVRVAGDAARTRAAGFRTHLAKPVDAALMVQSIAGVLEIRT